MRSLKKVRLNLAKFVRISRRKGERLFFGADCDARERVVAGEQQGLRRRGQTQMSPLLEVARLAEQDGLAGY